MKHYGDITKISGYEVPIVDCIIGGSPCQDLSVAGKRAGLKHGELGDDETTRSGLFIEQIRVVKEMRDNDELENGHTGYRIRPRFMVWENVPGAFSSNEGKDFQEVLTEIVRIVNPDAPDVPLPKKWTKSGCIYDELGRWSVAWRVHSAEFWGTPQRRKRIALVADFGGLAAPEVLFERQGLCWDPEQGREEGEGAAEGTEGSADETSYAIQGGGVTSQNSQGFGISKNVGYTLNAVDMHGVAYGFEPGAAKRLDPENRFSKECSPTIRATMGDNQTSVVCGVKDDDITTYAIQGGGATSVGQESPGIKKTSISYTLNTVDVHGVAYGICSDTSNSMKSNNPHSGIYKADTSKTLDLNGGSPTCNQGGMMILQKAQKDVPCLNEKETVGALCCDDYKGPNMQYVNQNKLIVCAQSCDQGEVIPQKDILCLNDQGGSVMDVSIGKTNTLRAQEHGHSPIVLETDD